MDKINPSHYKTGGIETINFIKAKLSPAGYEGYLEGNILKYISRHKEKGGIEDLKKAEWYLCRLIDEIQKKTEEAKK